MNDFQKLIQVIRQQYPEAELKIDEPQRDRQAGWLDIEYAGLWIVAEWRSWQGFGVSLMENTDHPYEGMFEGPDEVYETWTAARDRILFWLQSSESAEPRRRAAFG